MQVQLDRLCNQLAENPSGDIRAEIRRFTDDTRIGWADRLRYMRDTERGTIKTATCASYYFTIGFDVGYAHHAFQVAAEGGSTPNTLQQDALKTGLLHMQWVRQSLYSVSSLKETRPWSGYCVELWNQQFIIPIIERMLRDPPYRPASQELVGLAEQVKSHIDRALTNGIGELNIRRCPGTDTIMTEKGRRFARDGYLRDPHILDEMLNKLNKTIQEGRGFDPSSDNLTGTWSCSDGGTYTINHQGNSVSWTGKSADGGGFWTHTFQGKIFKDNNQYYIVGTFKDIPPGRMRNQGELVVKIIDNNQLEKVAEFMGKKSHRLFGGNTWTRRN